MILTGIVEANFGKYLKHYMLSTMGYSFVSRYYTIKDANTSRINPDTDKYELKPMLIRNKAMVLVLGTLVGLELWPCYLYRDLGKLELTLRGESIPKPSKYATFLDYILFE